MALRGVDELAMVWVPGVTAASLQGQSVLPAGTLSGEGIKTIAFFLGGSAWGQIRGFRKRLFTCIWTPSLAFY